VGFGLFLARRPRFVACPTNNACSRVPGAAAVAEPPKWRLLGAPRGYERVVRRMRHVSASGCGQDQIREPEGIGCRAISLGHYPRAVPRPGVVLLRLSRNRGTWKWTDVLRPVREPEGSFVARPGPRSYHTPPLAIQTLQVDKSRS
jgi:hypothetical protein